MSEDIVAELRHKADLIYDEDWPASHLLMLAADEIKRLRALLASHEIAPRAPNT